MHSNTPLTKPCFEQLCEPKKFKKGKFLRFSIFRLWACVCVCVGGEGIYSYTHTTYAHTHLLSSNFTLFLSVALFCSWFFFPENYSFLSTLFRLPSLAKNNERIDFRRESSTRLLPGSYLTCENCPQSTLNLKFKQITKQKTCNWLGIWNVDEFATLSLRLRRSTENENHAQCLSTAPQSAKHTIACAISAYVLHKYVHIERQRNLCNCVRCVLSVAHWRLWSLWALPLQFFRFSRYTHMHIHTPIHTHTDPRA